MPTTNPLKNQRIEFHILQSFPVTCLNRDDVGAPKTAIVGGVQRARVSSQAWKRPVRMAMHEFGSDLGIRTKRVAKLIVAACEENLKTRQAELTEELLSHIQTLADYVSKVLDDKSAQDDKTGEMKTSTLVFLSNSDASRIADAMSEFNFSLAELDAKIGSVSTNLKAAKKEKASDLISVHQEEKKRLEKIKNIADLLKDFNAFHDGLDIALFGRMVANSAKLNIEAAASFSHAISTHKVSNEVEFFTALDDCATEPGSAHMGSLEFNSATYYRYVSLDLGQLWQTLAGQNLPEAVENFTKALFVAVPTARQATQSGASPWEFAKVLVRKGQRLQVPFETAVKGKDGGFIQPSIEAMTGYLSKQEKLHGSLFGKQAEYTYGEDEKFSIDALVAALKQHASGCELEE
ncbi:MAG: type I-E CRISPR-associated protein Cas7/Cse4/CasC [Desulfuromonas sp.]